MLGLDVNCSPGWAAYHSHVAQKLSGPMLERNTDVSRLLTGAGDRQHRNMAAVRILGGGDNFGDGGGTAAPVPLAGTIACNVPTHMTPPVDDDRRGARNTVLFCADVSRVAGRVIGVRVRSGWSANVDEER